MATAITVLAVLFVLFVTLGVFVAIKAGKAAARGVDRTIAQARRTVEDTTLKAKTYAQPGTPAAELAELRLRLRTSMRATQEALGAGVTQDASLQESLALFQRLSAHGHELDDELKHMEREPDKVRLGERLPELRERTEQITEAADSLRWAARDRARKFADDDLSELGRQIDVESGALRHWTRVEPEGEGASGEVPGASGASNGASASPTGASSDVGAARPATPAWPEPTLVEGPGAAAEQSWPDPRQAEEGPQAIAPSRPVTYPWEKSKRPEETT